MRITTYPIDSLFTQRRSSFAFGHTPISRAQLRDLGAAASCAPYIGKVQPWHFIFITRESALWEVVFDCLVPFNRLWAAGGQAFMVMCARTDIPAHAFDTGAAWQALCLRAAEQHMLIRGIAGFDYERVAVLLHVPSTYTILAMAVMGSWGDPALLQPTLAAKEKLTMRNDIETYVFEGTMGDCR